MVGSKHSVSRQHSLSNGGADLPNPMLPASLQHSSHPPPLPSFETVVASWVGMERQSSATSGNQLNYRLTATPSAEAGFRQLPALSPPASRSYTRSVTKGGAGRMCCNRASGRLEKLKFPCKTMAPAASPPSSRQPG
jgi:hypothetical protein